MRSPTMSSVGEDVKHENSYTPLANECSYFLGGGRESIIFEVAYVHSWWLENSTSKCMP